MEMIFRRRFEAAHRLIEGVNANTLCSQPHGHSWEVLVGIEHHELKQLDGKANVLVPFSLAKGNWHKFVDQCLDHACFLNERDPMVDFLREHNNQGRLAILPGDPTTEILAAAFWHKAQALIQNSTPELEVTWLHLQETATNAIRVSKEEASRWIPRSSQSWWVRADFSTRD